ncbi:polysaccharide biosynthesis protein [Methylocystis sp. WRRC1]|uniref:polysaccharide biosynthesis protein n=1 Tax=Methylocystis sp. WRRC1 TaxID=1732014 RepID=UPI001D13589E|nr:polysaccharide biosynthesis protein [Methylocystis sp. WRRC1]
MSKLFEGKRILITGGTGSLGKTLVRRLLGGSEGRPARIVVLSRDEAKQHQMRVDYHNLRSPTDEVIYDNFHRLLQFQVGDVRDYATVEMALRDIDIVIGAAALKQVPTCEYFPFEAIQTNVLAAVNIVTAIARQQLPVETIVGVSTDKAVLPVNVMGMTKALQERTLISAQMKLPHTRVVVVRYGNVLASRGSVIPLFQQQIAAGGPVTITDERMTRFLLGLPEAVDAIFKAVREGRRGEIYVPKIGAARIVDIASAMIGDRGIPITTTGIRPGEKLHEVLISGAEAARTEDCGAYYAVKSILPEVDSDPIVCPVEFSEYSSDISPMSKEEVSELLESRGLMAPPPSHGEVLA